MIVMQTMAREDGVRLIRRYSDAGVMLRQDQTWNLYSEAVDVVGSGFTYSETDIPVDDSVSDEEALRILLGGETDESGEA